MDLMEAEKIVAQAFPGHTVSVAQTVPGKGAYAVHVDGELKGRNFDLTKALQEACLPVLEAAKAEHLAREKAKVEDFKLFGLFLMAKYAAEFKAWKDAKEAASYPPEAPTFKTEAQADAGA